MPADLTWEKMLTRIPAFTVVNLAKYIEKSGKDRALNRGYKFYMENYVHDVWVSGKLDMFFIKAKCYPSQKKNDEAHKLWVEINQATADISRAFCSCKAG